MIRSSDELNKAVMCACSALWQKVAMIVSRAAAASGDMADESALAALGACIEVLAREGKLETRGNLKSWRHSEARLPQSVTWFYIEHNNTCTTLRLISLDGINRLTLTTVAELGDILQSLAEEREPPPLIITGNDKFFSVGADLNEMAAHNSVSGYRFSRLGQHVMDQLDQFPALTVAAISGNCFGGAIDMALACDLRICASNAMFGHRGAALGLLTGWGGTQRLPRLIGKARALQMFCAAERLGAQEALRIGLVNEIAEDPVEAAVGRIHNSKFKIQN